MDVTNKVAVVTGGGRGIGRGISLILAQNGADVAVGDVHPENAQTVAMEVTQLERRSLAVTLDVTDEESTQRMVREVMDHFGRIDILINNAGVVGAEGWEQREKPNDSDWNFVFAVNVRGIARVTEAVAPHMKANRYGKIINIASIAGRQGSPRNPPYNMSKAGVVNLTQSQSLELAPYNINVNAICPGLLWTPIWERIVNRPAMTPNPEGKSGRELFLGYVQETTPLGREQTPEDIGNLAAFLASDYANNITGQSINVSGGYFMN